MDPGFPTADWRSESPYFNQYHSGFRHRCLVYCGPLLPFFEKTTKRFEIIYVECSISGGILKKLMTVVSMVCAGLGVGVGIGWVGKRREGDLHFTCSEKGLHSVIPLNFVICPYITYSKNCRKFKSLKHSLIYYWHSTSKQTHPTFKLHES